MYLFTSKSCGIAWDSVVMSALVMFSVLQVRELSRWAASSDNEVLSQAIPPPTLPADKFITLSQVALGCFFNLDCQVSVCGCKPL